MKEIIGTILTAGEATLGRKHNIMVRTQDNKVRFCCNYDHMQHPKTLSAVFFICNIEITIIIKPTWISFLFLF